jgi:hypothetical protein
MLFGKKKETAVKQPSEKEIEQKRKQEDINRIAGEIEQLTSGQTLIYKLPEFYWGGFGAFLIVELNSEYPKNGKKYHMSIDKGADGKPSSNRGLYLKSNDPKYFAKEILDRHAERYT